MRDNQIDLSFFTMSTISDKGTWYTVLNCCQSLPLAHSKLAYLQNVVLPKPGSPIIMVRVDVGPFSIAGNKSQGFLILLGFIFVLLSYF